MGQHKNTPAKGRPTEVVTIFLPKSVVGALEILAKQRGWTAVEMMEAAMTGWDEALTRADIRDACVTKAAGVPFPPRNGALLRGRGDAFDMDEPVYRYPMKLHKDTVDKMGNISYWRGLWRADVMREAIAHFIAIHDPEGTWADWYFERGNVIVPRGVKLEIDQKEVFNGKKLAKSSINLATIGSQQERPNGDGNP